MSDEQSQLKDIERYRDWLVALAGAYDKLFAQAKQAETPEAYRHLTLGVGGLLYFAFVETRPIIEAILKADLVEDTEQDA